MYRKRLLDRNVIVNAGLFIILKNITIDSKKFIENKE
jgi:hypothetical protein